MRVTRFLGKYRFSCCRARQAMPDFDHWLITRYNVPLSTNPGFSTDPGWLELRRRLFAAYCEPSVAHQTCQGFRWLLLVDRETPQRRLEYVLNKERCRAFDTFAVGPNWVEELASYLARRCRSKFVLTSRLDSDDALHREYVRTVQAGFRRQSFEFLELPCGLKLEEGQRRLYEVRCRSGPFLTLVERTAGVLRTVHCCDHARAHEIGALSTLELDDAWLQVVHGRNVLNRIDDGLSSVPSSRLGTGFPWLQLLL